MIETEFHMHDKAIKSRIRQLEKQIEEEEKEAKVIKDKQI